MWLRSGWPPHEQDWEPRQRFAAPMRRGCGILAGIQHTGGGDVNDEQFDDLRAELYGAPAQFVDEVQLDLLLRSVVDRARDDLREEFGVELVKRRSWSRRLGLDRPENVDRTTAERMLVSVEAWASVVSHLTNEAYEGPLREIGAFKRKVVGWSRGVAARLTELSELLAGYLQKAMEALHASSFSIAVGFPIGVQVSLSWG
jgi:hypothetical protein